MMNIDGSYVYFKKVQFVVLFNVRVAVGVVLFKIGFFKQKSSVCKLTAAIIAVVDVVVIRRIGRRVSRVVKLFIA